MDYLENQLTDDGSSTLFNKKVGEHYHSTFGALQESRHIFIEAGLNALDRDLKEINLLEIGFGTGLNALLAMEWAEHQNRLVNYLGVEAFPISGIEIGQLNYAEMLGIEKKRFLQLHQQEFNNSMIGANFHHQVKFQKIQEANLPAHHFHAVFFDAFSPDAQPELWTEEIFTKIAGSMKRGGVLTTYSCKGIVKRALKAAGFQIEKLPGPVGKREILRTTLN